MRVGPPGGWVRNSPPFVPPAHAPAATQMPPKGGLGLELQTHLDALGLHLDALGSYLDLEAGVRNPPPFVPPAHGSGCVFRPSVRPA